MSTISFSSTKEGDVTILTIKGSLDLQAAPKLNARLEEEVAKGADKFVLDFTHVDYLASASLGVIISFHSKLTKSGGQMRIAGMTEKIKKIFSLLGFTNLFTVYKNNEEAVKSLK